MSEQVKLEIQEPKNRRERRALARAAKKGPRKPIPTFRYTLKVGQTVRRHSGKVEYEVTATSELGDWVQLNNKSPWYHVGTAGFIIVKKRKDASDDEVRKHDEWQAQLAEIEKRVRPKPGDKIDVAPGFSVVG
jgi:hypothetical protein